MIYDQIIMGGGVVGCAILNKLTRLNQKVLLIERENDVATGTTKANSGIVHAGYDPATGTLKAKLNVLGASIFPSLCEQLHVPLIKNGAFVLGDDLDAIHRLYTRGEANGVHGLHILNRQELLEKIPNLTDNITCGLYSETSAIVSPYMFAIALAEEAILNGGEVKLNYVTSSITIDENDNFVVSDGKTKYVAKSLINATGAHFNDISELMGAEKYDLQYRRGEYYLLDTTASNLTKYTLFPLPTKAGKGVLITPTADGNILIGPTSERSDLQTITTKAGLDDVYKKANTILKNIPFKKTIRVFSGVRTICGDDFIVEKSKIVPNLVNIAGICSPGLASSPGIAEYVAVLLKITGNEKSMRSRVAIPRVRDLSDEEVQKLVEKDKQFGQVVCSCEGVTKGEIIMAINSPLRPTSVDGIKRRVRAGMGRCQGGFCFSKVMSLISDYADIPFDKVPKDKSGSSFVVDDIK